jgi:beta-glucosidase
MNPGRFFLALAASTAIFCPPKNVFGEDNSPLYKNSQAPLEQRVDDLFGQLTQAEKLSLLGGTGFTTQPIPRLGVPAMMMSDAGQGVRGGSPKMAGPATAFPAGVVMASTWDTNLLRQIGQAIGEEARNKGSGAQVLLGPAVNIHRTPQGGRNGEYMSEDPFLAARLAVPYIQGMQSVGVAACIKHFACNNQEEDRMKVDVNVSERALREIYLPAFEAGVKEGKVWSLMSSYNVVNGSHSSANYYLLTDILKKEWGFDGLVMSDWGGVHETAVVQAGNDLEMPTGKNMSVKKLKAALLNGSVTQAAVDDSIHRILRTVIRTGLLDGLPKPDAKMVNSAAHKKLAYEVAAHGIVLLKNENGILPLDRAQIKSIAVIGEAASDMQIDAGGSPAVVPLHTVQILDGIKNLAGSGIAVTYAATQTGADIFVPNAANNAHGFRAEYFTNNTFKSASAYTHNETSVSLNQWYGLPHKLPADNFSVRWTGKVIAPENGDYAFQFTFTGGEGFRVFLDDKLILEHAANSVGNAASAMANLEAGKNYALRVEYFLTAKNYFAFNLRPPFKTSYDHAIAAAKNADVAVVCVSTRRQEGETKDRPSLALPDEQDDLIRAVAKANNHTVVVLNNGTPVLMKNWLGQIPALIEAWFPGQEGGDALAAILFGDVNPSGKLPDTLAANREDYPDFGNFPGAHDQENYAEGIYVGYRHFDQANIEPLFPFGYGLSYTTFAYKNLKLSQTELQPDSGVTASVDITNTGKRAGEEIAELYVHDTAPKIDKPVRELKGFAKIALAPGETKTVTFTIAPRALAYFDVPNHQWKADAGNYEIEIGASSRDVRQKADLQLAGTFTESVRLMKNN